LPVHGCLQNSMLHLSFWLVPRQEKYHAAKILNAIFPDAKNSLQATHSCSGEPGSAVERETLGLVVLGNEFITNSVNSFDQAVVFIAVDLFPDSGDIDADCIRRYL
jgi:hypothetical protein